MLRIVFMGSDAIALPALNWLARGDIGQVVAVCTQPDRAAGRGQKVQANAIKLWALERGLSVLQPEKIGAAERKQLADLQPDLTLVMAYGHILKQDVITTPRLGTLNLHTSVLPQYRGASPIQTAIACGEKETGVTLMQLVRELDAGPVADVERVAIAPLDTATEVESRLAQACVPLLARCLPAIAAGTQIFTAQNADQVTFCRRLEKSDGGLDFTKPAAALDALAKNQATRPAVQTTFSDDFPKEGINYTVQAGDTLSGIAKKTGAKLSDIRNANKIVDDTRIRVGQTLFIPQGK
jgi:methionyl-tRNA formyltransferase